jgi:hypothetical protein
MLPIAGLRDRIKASVVPRVATTNSFGRQPGTFEDAVLAERVLGIVRTGRQVAATVPYERGKGKAIQIDKPDERIGCQRGPKRTVG